MLVYKTPTAKALEWRKQFHATQKQQSENISDWFKRLQDFIVKCEFDQMTDYMLADKFISALDEMDFQKISQVPSWTLENLVLVVIGNGHIFNTISTKEKQSNEIAGVHVKYENEFQASDMENELNDHSSWNEEEGTGDVTVNNTEENGKPAKTSTTKRARLSKTVRNQRYYQRLVERGQYDEFKKKRALRAKQRRLKMKQTEQYLPPELQLHLMNERRRACRERVKRYRDRKSQKKMDEPTVDLKKKQSAPPRPAFISEPLPDEAGFESYFEPDDLDHDIDFDPANESQLLEPKKEPDLNEIEPELNEIVSELQPKSKRPIRKCTARKYIANKKREKNAQKKPTYIRKRTFECYLCSLKCSKIYELKAHLAVFHPCEEQKKDLLNCPYCTKTTTSREVLSRHLRKIHSTLQVHKCPCCDAEFKMRGQLTEHMSQHPEYRPFICETCASSFRSMSELNQHLRRHTGEKMAKCDVCGLQLASSSSLKAHMMRHTGERPYPCRLCEKEFRQDSSLRKHLISVHKQGEKKFVCKTCEKRFASIYHLRIHENIHTGARPYDCCYCGSDFNQPSALKTHINRIHGNQPSARAKPKTAEEQTN